MNLQLDAVLIFVGLSTCGIIHLHLAGAFLGCPRAPIKAVKAKTLNRSNRPVSAYQVYAVTGFFYALVFFQKTV
jgi:hypothetical protein